MKTPIKDSIMMTVVGFEKWCEENKEEFLKKQQQLNEEEEVKEKEDCFCEHCSDEGVIEIIGDGEGFECDVIGYKKCKYCQNND